MSTALRKDLPPARTGPDEAGVHVHAPALDELSRAPSCSEGLTRLLRAGRLGELQADVGQVARTGKALAAGALAQIAEFDRLGATMTNPVEAAGFRRAAEQLREETGIQA